MTPVMQTEFYHTHNRGNCFQAVIASLLDIPLEEAFPVHLYYHLDLWNEPLNDWLAERGLLWRNAPEFEVFHTGGYDEALKDVFYLVSGPSPRDPTRHHIVIYNAGRMVHDPHPDNTGVLKINYIETIEPIECHSPTT